MIFRLYDKHHWIRICSTSSSLFLNWSKSWEIRFITLMMRTFWIMQSSSRYNPLESTNYVSLKETVGVSAPCHCFHMFSSPYESHDMPSCLFKYSWNRFHLQHLSHLVLAWNVTSKSHSAFSFTFSQTSELAGVLWRIKNLYHNLVSLVLDLTE